MKKHELEEQELVEQSLKLLTEEVETDRTPIFKRIGGLVTLTEGRTDD